MPKVRGGRQIPSTNMLAQFARRGAMHDFLEFYSFRDRYFYLDDFGGDTINLDYYALAAAGTGGATFAVHIQNGTGVVRGSTGTDDNAATSLIGPIIFRGDNNCGMWARLKIDVVTSFQMDVGFIDAVPAAAASGVNDVDTPTVTMADGALLHMDTDDTLQTCAFVTVGSTANQAVKATTLDPAFAPTAATFFDVVVQLIGNDAYCIVNGGTHVVSHHNGTGNNAAGHVEGGVNLAPWIYVATRNTTAKLVDLDALAVWSDRIA